MIYHRQPDGVSCGASTLVTARMLTDPAVEQAGAEPAQWADLVRKAHRQLTGLVGVDGRLQLPWPRFLGTPPWSMVRAMRALDTDRAADYRWTTTRFTRGNRRLTAKYGARSDGSPRESAQKLPGQVHPGPAHPGPAQELPGRVFREARPERPVVVYVGSRWLPRHVMLVTGADDTSTTFYNPATGRLARFSHADWPGPASRWRTFWGVIG